MENRGTFSVLLFCLFVFFFSLCPSSYSFDAPVKCIIYFKHWIIFNGPPIVIYLVLLTYPSIKSSVPSQSPFSGRSLSVIYTLSRMTGVHTHSLPPGSKPQHRLEGWRVNLDGWHFRGQAGLGGRHIMKTTEGRSPWRQKPMGLLNPPERLVWITGNPTWPYSRTQWAAFHSLFMSNTQSFSDRWKNQVTVLAGLAQ